MHVDAYFTFFALNRRQRIKEQPGQKKTLTSCPFDLVRLLQ